MKYNTSKNHYKSKANLFKKHIKSSLLFFCVCLIIIMSTNTFAQSIKLVIGQYDCFSDSDCTNAGLNGYCDTNENQCVICPGRQEPKDKECVCPADTHKLGSECIECNTESEVWNGERCICNEENGYHRINNICATCPADKPYWNGDKCVQCLSSSDCIDSLKPWCDTANNEYACKSCPPTKPFWTGERCGCTQNQHCKSLTSPWCNIITHKCSRCPQGSKWNKELQNCVCTDQHKIIASGECICDQSKGWYDNLNGSCTKINCLPYSEPFTAKGAFTFCTEHDRWVRIDTFDNEIRVSFLDGWNGLHNFAYNLYGCRCTDYNTYNTTGSEKGHWNDATVHKLNYSGYKLKFPIYMGLNGVGCDEGTNGRSVYAITAPGIWVKAGTCPGNGSTETNITYSIQTEVEGYKCPINGGICNTQNQCVGGDEQFKENTENICELPQATDSCQCPFGKKKIQGKCDWQCSNGQVIQEDGTCVCPQGTTFKDNWCRANCNEAQGYTYDLAAQKCVCNNDAGYYTNTSGQCVYCYGPTKRWNDATKQCDSVCMEQTYTVSSPAYSAQYPTSRWNEEKQACECNPNIFFFGEYPNCKRCQSTGTMYNPETGKCICDTERGYETPNGGCGMCLPGSQPNAERTGCECSAENSFMYPLGECESCGIYTTEVTLNNREACSKCITGGIRFWQSSTSKCIRCDTANSIVNVEETDCNACQNRIWLNNKTCTTCTYNTISGISSQQCHRCSFRFWSNNTCYLCSQQTTVMNNVSQVECLKCNNLCWKGKYGEESNANTLGRCGPCSLIKTEIRKEEEEAQKQAEEEAAKNSESNSESENDTESDSSSDI